MIARGYARGGMSPAEPPVAAVPPATAPDRILPANQLFLTTVLLLIAFGSVMQYLWPQPGLIGTELFCILLPAWCFARRTGSASTALRLRWPGWAPCVLGTVGGALLLPLALLADEAAKAALGYEFRMPDRWVPVGLPATVIFLIGAAIAAPFCEEMVFRGYILGAYERAVRPRTAVLAVAAMFTAWHMSPARAPGVAVLALALTYLAWRTGSVWPSVAMHLGANATGASLELSRWDPGWRIAIPATLAAGACLWAAGRGFSAARPPAERGRGGWGPLWVACSILALAAGGEVAAHHWRIVPARGETVVRVRPSWTAPVRLRYEIYRAEGFAGSAEYRITPGKDAVRFEATLHLGRPNELTGEPAKVAMEGEWERRSMVLRRIAGTVEGRSRFENSESGAPVDMPAFARWFYSPVELPWRLSAAAMIEERTGRAVTVKLHEAPLVAGIGAEREIRLQGDTREEALRTPAGRFRTVRIAWGKDASLWYDVERPHVLVQWRTDKETWMLVGRE